MRFSEPGVLYFLLLIPVLYVLLMIIGKKRLKSITMLGNPDTLNSFSNKNLYGNFKRESLFISLAFLFFLFALAGPQAGTRLEPVKITGSDIYIAIDLSKSMRAEDIRPTRIERAKIDAIELVKSLQGDRIGLILFAGDAFVQCPLTTDYDAVITFINSLDTESAVSAGTSLFAPLEVALTSITPKEEKYSIILLLTDGENTGARNEKVLKDLQHRGIKVFSIGIGTKEGTPIPLFDESGRRTGYKKDKEGRVVISRLADDLLKEIAQKTNGYFIEAGGGLNEVGKFLAIVNAMKKRELETKKYTVYEERFQIPLGVGMLFLIFFITSTLKTKRKIVW